MKMPTVRAQGVGVRAGLATTMLLGLLALGWEVLDGIAQVRPGKPKDEFTPSTKAMSATPRVGDKTLKEWRSDLSHADPSQRAIAILAILNFGEESKYAVRDIIKCLSDRDLSPRAKACIALRTMEIDKDDVYKVIDALAARLDPRTEEQAIIRYEAAVSLRRFVEDAHRAIPALIKGTEDRTSWEIRHTCAGTLWRAAKDSKKGPNPTAVRALLNLLVSDKNVSQVRLEVIIGLGEMGPASDTRLASEVISQLELATRSNDELQALWAHAGLVRVGDARRADLALNKIAQFLKNDALEIRIQAAGVMAALGARARKRIDALMAMLADSDLSAVSAAALALVQIEEKIRGKVGLILNDPKACQGYTLIADMKSNDTHLIDMRGRVVQTWKSNCPPATSAYLLENGHLLRPGMSSNPSFRGPATGGRLQEFDRNGKIIWDYQFSNPKQQPHHDVCPLPNGNVLMIVWEKKTAREAIAAGRRPETVKDELMADCILEVKPTGETTGKIVWEWHAWDHLVQEFDKTKANFGDVGKHPEKIDINFGDGVIASMIAKPEELKKLQALGYVGGTNRKPQRVQPDWLHINAVAYNAELNQIMLSVHEFSEIWVIDHSTTTAEAKTNRGGKSGKGGGLLYRWGNPRAYRAGTVRDQKLFSQHNAHWIPKGYPGAGNILVFNNGLRRIGGAHSTVDEIVPPVQARGKYRYEPGKAFGPDRPTWTYSAPKRTDFFAPLLSGAQRLSNGNTLICSGTNGTVFEVTPKKDIVWKYINPPRGGGMSGPGFFAPPLPGHLLSGFIRNMLQCSDEQNKQLDAADKEIVGRLHKILTDQQKKQFKERPSFHPGSFPKPGQIVADAVVEKMKLTQKQKTQLADLQKVADGKLAQILKENQRKRLKEMQEARGPSFRVTPGLAAPGGGGSLFRAPRYEGKYPGLPRRAVTGQDS